MTARESEPKALEKVTVHGAGSSGKPAAQSRWSPIVGDETAGLMRHLDRSGKVGTVASEDIKRQALRVLSCCVPPTDPGTTVGLVIGYVQSGKTLNITTVAALARDNGYRVVVLLTGTSNPLLDQSTSRVEADLRISDPRAPNRAWQLLVNPSVKDRANASIENALEAWSDPDIPRASRRTLFLPVMKHVTHLRNLTQVFKRVGKKLEGAPILIIDDEADQASMNTLVNRDEESATHKEILELRTSIPNHSYLQYTATPQAPLLINVIDLLSPEFAEVLAPGEGYTGGGTFFQDATLLVRVIPDEELPTKEGAPEELPRSLEEAMRVFFLGVAAGYVESDGTGNRSMMVHPAVRKLQHKTYDRWVRSVAERWKDLLGKDDGDPDRVELVNEFKTSYADLAQTVSDLPAFEDVLTLLRHAIRETEVKEINTRKGGRTPNVPWVERYPWILVGGTALDRGFTVEGLTVTYMPRGGGVGNADTIQQRARFFGYKEDYLGYCRVYLPSDLRQQYSSYTEHEENVRVQIAKHVESGESLATWKRVFVLDSSLRPTRQTVLDMDYYRLRSKKGDWHGISRPHVVESTRRSNLDAVNAFCERHKEEFVWTPSDSRATKDQRHTQIEIPVDELLDQLLVNLGWGSTVDSTLYTALLVQIEHLAETGQVVGATVYKMADGNLRIRSLKGDRIPQLFQGSNESSGYGGDREVYPTDPARIAVQIHWLSVLEEGLKRTKANAQRGIPAVALGFNLQRPHGTYVQIGQ